MAPGGDLDADRGGDDRDEGDEPESRHGRARARAVGRRLEVATFHDQERQDRRGDEGRDERAASQDVGEDGDREHHARDEPRATLPAPNTAGHHDHRDAGDGGEGGRRLGDAEGEERLDVVEAAAKWRRRGDDDVDRVRRGTSSPLAQRRTVRCRRCSLSRSTVTGKGLPVGHEPTVEPSRSDGARLHVGVARRALRGAVRGRVASRRRRGEPAPRSPPRSRRRRGARPTLKTGGSPNRPRRSTMTVRDGPAPRTRRGRGRRAPVAGRRRRPRRHRRARRCDARTPGRRRRRRA